MAREYVRFVIESSYGTPKSTPVVGTDAFYARLHDSDIFSGQMNPVLLDIPYGGGVNTPADQVTDQTSTMFAFRTFLYPGAHSATLLNWCMTPVNVGRTAPWTTTDAGSVMPVGDLASLSFYHAIQMDDGSLDRRRYGGAKCLTWSLTASRQDPRWILSVTGQAIRDDLNAAGSVAYPDATEFPLPTEAQYPLGPYLFSHSAGGLTIVNTGSTLRTQYESLTLGARNVVDPCYWESKYPSMMKFCGRTSSLSSRMRLKVSPNDLAWLQSATALKTSLVITNGTNTLTFQFNAKNYLKGVTRNLAIGQEYRRQVDVQNFFDPAAAADISVTAA